MVVFLAVLILPYFKNNRGKVIAVKRNSILINLSTILFFH